MGLEAVERLLKEHMGLHSATIGASTVHQAVEQRMRDCGIADAGEYLNVLQHSVTERDALIDAVVIPETWFYRDQNPFTAFSAWLGGEWLPSQAHSVLRLLSVPCSSGEEPYTLAMCLADLNVPESAAHIDAVDISHANIEKARRACYGSYSFRGADLAFRERYFVEENQRYRLVDSVRCRVSFARANILDPEFFAQREPYHAIFCRNLLIYFDRPTQDAAIESLDRLLHPDGILFLGHSETSLLMQRRFVPLAYPRCFAFRRGEPAAEAAPCTPRPRRPAAAGRKAPAAPQPPASPFAAVAPRASGQPGDLDDVRQQAFRLADEGHMDEAAERCEILLRHPAHQVDAHYLLGLIREATGNRDAAEQQLRKVVYLDPGHYEALSHLSVICAQNGDHDSARRFRERAERVRRRQAQAEVEA